MIKKLFKCRTGQGSIEYLLIIGAALLVSIIAVTLILGINSSNKQTANLTQSQYTKLIDTTIIGPLITNISCTTSDVTLTITPSPTQGVLEYYLVIDGVLQTTPACSDTNPLVCSKTLAAGTQYSIALMAKKGEAYSSPSKGGPCTP